MSCIHNALKFLVHERYVSFCFCMPNLGSLISIASCVGSGILLHLDQSLPLVDELTYAFLVCDELMKPFCIWPVCVGCTCGFCVGVLFTAPSFDDMNVQTARALRPGRRMLIHYHGDTSLRENASDHHQ